MDVAAIVPAAGSGKRFGGKLPKQFLLLEGKPLLVHTLQNLDRAHAFRERIVAVAPSEVKKTEALLSKNKLGGWRVVAGGATRAESVWNALQAASRSEWVLVHDAARPMIGKKLVIDTIRAAAKTGAALAALPAFATVKKVDPLKGIVLTTQDRNTIYLAQTPQVARRKLLELRYRKLGRRAFSLTDEAAFFDGTPVKVKVVMGDPHNIKITTREDLAFFRSAK